MIRKALVPAAGRGARLDRPDTPKPLVDVGGTPLIVRLLAQLERAGVREAVVVVGYQAPALIRALTLHRDLRLTLRFLENPEWTGGLARSVLAARDHFGPAEPFLLAMADHVFDDSLVTRMAAQAPEPDGLVALVEEQTERVFDLAAAMKVRRTGERMVDIGRALTPFDAVDAGLFVATPTLFEALEQVSDPPADFDSCEGVRHLAQAGRVRVITTGEGHFDDVDTPAGLIHAELRLRHDRRQHQVRRQAWAVPAAHPYKFATGAPETTEVLVGRGLIAAPERLPLIPEASASSPIFVFTDQTVNRLYGDTFVGGLQRAGYDVHRIVMADGEESKTLSNYVYLVERVLARGIDERSLLISLGGGAVCNVCGLVASTLYRGIGLAHVPTTLMAQCDAAISHKQGVNGPRGKNLVGAYYAPRTIVVDIDVLATLADWLIPDGLAEVIKHALAQDPDYADWLEVFDGNPRDPAFLEAVVRRNIELKCKLMQADPHELNEGMALQYGHTIGHPVEFLSGYRLSHGQSVAVGMMVAARVARLLGACNDDLVARHERLLRKFSLPTALPAGLHIADILDTMRYNKRYLTEGTRMALLRDVGQLWSVDRQWAIPVCESVLVRALEMSFAA